MINMESQNTLSPAKEKKIRSLAQNNAIHKWLDDNAKRMKEQGITLQQILAMSFEIFPTKENLKEDVWKQIQWALFNKKSTTELNTNEIDPILDVFIKNVGQATGYEFTPFPSIDEIIHQQREEEMRTQLKKKTK